MMNISFNRQFLLFWLLLIAMLISFSLTLIFEVQFIDEITITSGILTGIASFIMGLFLLLETILSICNP